MAAIALPGVDWNAILQSVIYWTGYSLATIAIGAVFVVIIIISQYKYQVEIFQRGGSGKNEPSGKEDHFIVKRIKDRAKQIKDKNGIIKWKLLKLKKTIPPVDFKYIYPGKKIFLYQTGPTNFFPIKFTCTNPEANFTPVETDLDFWAGLELQEIAKDYQALTTWDRYGNTIVMMGTILFCLILVGVTVYYTYQHANGVTSGLSDLSNTLKTITL
jgi:hypothetical protein